ncbi:MAG: NAD(P)-binding protein [Methanobacterium sp.]|nr:NAD(P)-binding protein [Methanobacterium sp.]
MVAISRNTPPPHPDFPSRAFDTNPSGAGSGGEELPIPGQVDVAIVGGGLAGLTAARGLAGRRILLLEQCDDLGGNARTARYHGLGFPVAGSCLQQPVPGGRVDRLLRDLGLGNHWRSTASDSQVMFRTGLLVRNLGTVSLAFLRRPGWLLDSRVYGLTGALVRALLTGLPYIAAPKQLGDPIFASLYAYLGRLAPGKGRYPSIPWNPADGWTREEMEIFDSVSLEQVLFDSSVRSRLPAGLVPPAKLGRLIRDAVETTLRVECLRLDRVSGYVGLHFLVGYLYGVLVAFPGGNGFVSERLLDGLKKNAGFSRVVGCRVDAVRPAPAGGYQLTCRYQGRALVLSARAVVWAAPKYAAVEAIPDLPPAQRAAMARIDYGDYVVATVMLRTPLWSDRFGGYVIDGAADPARAGGWCRAGGFVVANWLDPARIHPAGVLPLLKPGTDSEAQGRLATTSFAALQDAAFGEISDILSSSGIPATVIEDIRIWRWPKGLVSPRPGDMKNDLFLQASARWGGIVFANQDSYGVGNFEAAVLSGLDAARSLQEDWPASADFGPGRDAVTA